MFVPHAAPIIYSAVCLAVLAILQWFQGRGCKCGERGEFLKPRWRRYEK